MKQRCMLYLAMVMAITSSASYADGGSKTVPPTPTEGQLERALIHVATRVTTAPVVTAAAGIGIGRRIRSWIRSGIGRECVAAV